MTPPTPPAGARLTDEQLVMQVKLLMAESVRWRQEEQTYRTLLALVQLEPQQQRDDRERLAFAAHAAAVVAETRLYALSELQAHRQSEAMHRAAARVSGGDAAVNDGNDACGKAFACCKIQGHDGPCLPGRLIDEPVSQPAAQEVAPLAREIWTNSQSIYRAEVGNTRHVEAANMAIDYIAATLRSALARVAPPAPSVEALESLLRRIRAWDMLDSAGDGPYWKAEIDAALQRREGAQK